MDQQEAASGNQFTLTPPTNATPEELALWLADTRTRAHRLIDESVTAAQEMLNKRASSIDEGDATAQAQRHAQRLAIERLRRAIGDLTLEIRGVHGRLDRLETLIRAALEAPAAARQEVAPRPATRPVALGELSVSDDAPAPPLAVATVPVSAPAIETVPEALATESVAPRNEIVDVSSAPIAAETPQRTEPEHAPEKEPAPTGFAAEARAAVEAAVASALQEARRAASLRPLTPQVEDEPEAPRPLAPEERVEAPTPERLERSEPVAPVAPAAMLEEPRTATVAPPAATVAQREDVPKAPAPQASPPAVEPSRPSLWVPPSAIAPRRAEPSTAPVETPSEETRPMVAASLPASAVPPSLGGAAAAVAAPVVAPVSPVTSPFEGNPQAAAAAAAAVSRFAAATAAATTERLAPGTFGPDGGPIVLRIAPISGFQGLMRVQDAVVQHPPVREATVEAYARGEARLRLQLASPLEADALSSALSRSLGLQARIESVSDDERSIQVTLA